MASIPVLPLLLVFLLPVHANAQRNQSNSNIILLGSSLSPNANRTSWLSPSGLFAFGFYPQDDGFAIGIWLVNQTEKTIIWTANRDDPPVSSNATLNLTIDGKLLLITEQGRELSIIDVDQEDRPATSAAMLDSGNFVLYRNDSYVIWDSFDFPTDTILGGQNLSSGNNLVSSRSISDHSSGHYSFNMQEDGNLVAYPVNSSANTLDAYWYSATDYGNVYASLILSRLGVLFVHLSEFPRFILANSSYPDKNGTTIYRATLDADGIFRLYLHHFKSDNSSSMLMEWSALSDQCDVKGFCGLNSYCSGMGSKADCNCYPGFDFINTSNKFLGCYHNFSEDDCRRSKDPAMLYNATSLANIVLRGNYPYSVEPMKKENCGQFCLEDCNCGAVSYTDSNCRKYKLPLRYGIINANESTPTFFKLKGIHSTQIPELFIGSKSLILILSVILGTVSCLCLVLAASSFFVYRQKLVRYRKLSENVNLGLAEEFTLRLFSYNELESATDGFKEELAKADIYSFGVVLLEIVCCRRSIEVNVSTTDEIILTDWVYNCFAAGELEKLVEDENVDFRKLERTVKVGLWCVQEDSALRPSIKNVILMLEGTIDIPVPPSPVLCIAVS
ncbi:g-type lectin s-receptor-like serine/threonine-protein kinase lecrk1 [Quercus suber]|uniref:G-type lectin s-receptor-like serine/threonine-protein kinase lecrk1 n=1 Tax=Quercus suber TaxID=58331 RepID=A0AAW0M9X8_QUESU